jgi:hypothetical protein
MWSKGREKDKTMIVLHFVLTIRDLLFLYPLKEVEFGAEILCHVSHHVIYTYAKFQIFSKL